MSYQADTPSSRPSHSSDDDTRSPDPAVSRDPDPSAAANERERRSSLSSLPHRPSHLEKAAALERERAALFRTTGLGKRQQQQQELYAPSSFTRAKSSWGGVSGKSDDEFRRVPSVEGGIIRESVTGEYLISSRDWSLQTLYDCVGLPSTPLQVMDLARMLFEGLCTKAVVQSQKEAFKGQESGGYSHTFAKPPKAPVAGKKNIAFGSSDGQGSRRWGEYLNSGELRTQDYSLLQELLSRARLPQGCGTCIQMDSIRKMFVAKRTASTHVLQLEGFCDGLVSLAECISDCLLSGSSEEVAMLSAPKSLPELDMVPWSFEQKAKGLTDVAFTLHRLLGRLILIITKFD